jgi:hypothetical protein
MPPPPPALEVSLLNWSQGSCVLSEVIKGGPVVTASVSDSGASLSKHTSKQRIHKQGKLFATQLGQACPASSVKHLPTCQPLVWSISTRALVPTSTAWLPHPLVNVAHYQGTHPALLNIDMDLSTLNPKTLQ